MRIVRWVLWPTVCEQCRRPLWLVRCVERVAPIPVGLPVAPIFDRYCLVCVALMPASAEAGKEE